MFSAGFAHSLARKQERASQKHGQSKNQSQNQSQTEDYMNTSAGLNVSNSISVTSHSNMNSSMTSSDSTVRDLQSILVRSASMKRVGVDGLDATTTVPNTSSVHVQNGRSSPRPSNAPNANANANAPATAKVGLYDEYQGRTTLPPNPTNSTGQLARGSVAHRRRVGSAISRDSLKKLRQGVVVGTNATGYKPVKQVRPKSSHINSIKNSGAASIKKVATPVSAPRGRNNSLQTATLLALSSGYPTHPNNYPIIEDSLHANNMSREIGPRFPSVRPPSAGLNKNALNTDWTCKDLLRERLERPPSAHSRVLERPPSAHSRPPSAHAYYRPPSAGNSRPPSAGGRQSLTQSFRDVASPHGDCFPSIL